VLVLSAIGNAGPKIVPLATFADYAIKSSSSRVHAALALALRKYTCFRDSVSLLQKLSYS